MRIDQGGELADDLAAAHLDRTDLGDRVSVSVRGGVRPRSGGLEVDDDERGVPQRRLSDGVDVSEAQLIVGVKDGHGD